MKITVYLSVLLLTIVIKTVMVNSILQLPPQQYCGSKLADIMQIVCNKKYNGPTNGKKRNEIGKSIICI